MTEKQIKAEYKRLHDDLSKIYYDGIMGITKEEFDAQHGMIWDGLEAQLIAEGYLPPPRPRRDLAAEIDALRQDNIEMKDKLKQAGID